MPNLFLREQQACIEQFTKFQPESGHSFICPKKVLQRWANFYFLLTNTRRHTMMSGKVPSLSMNCILTNHDERKAAKDV